MEPGIRCKPIRPGILPRPAPPFPFGKITKAALQEKGGSLKTEMRIGLTRQRGKLVFETLKKAFHCEEAVRRGNPPVRAEMYRIVP